MRLPFDLFMIFAILISSTGFLIPLIKLRNIDRKMAKLISNSGRSCQSKQRGLKRINWQHSIVNSDESLLLSKTAESLFPLLRFRIRAFIFVLVMFLLAMVVMKN